MNSILEQFISEARDFLQGIGEKLIDLENAPGDAALMTELFRLVHTLKGNCGLFDFPEMLRVLHAAEDLMVVVREGDLAYSQVLADCLLEAMDFVSLLLDEIEASGSSNAGHAGASAKLAEALRQLISNASGSRPVAAAPVAAVPGPEQEDSASTLRLLSEVPQALRLAWVREAGADAALWLVSYTPEAECFFKGEDPLFQARQTPHVVWAGVRSSGPWPALAQLDTYRCSLVFTLISTASRAQIEEHFRYIPEQIDIVAVTSVLLASSLGDGRSGAAREGAEGAATSVHAVAAPGGDAPAADAPENAVINAQLAVLRLPDQVAWLPGRLKAVAATLGACLRSTGRGALVPALEAALAGALAQASSGPLLAWLTQQWAGQGSDAGRPVPTDQAPARQALEAAPPPAGGQPGFARRADDAAAASSGGEAKFGRRADDAVAGAKTLKVDQEKIDRLMGLIGEMVVAKNGLPYLAGRAEEVFGVRELSREIKSQYSVINRIAEEMQDAIMQVRMMPVSFIFQRFPRLVRDISRKLGKEVSLVLEGEETEADKNIIEALADPLIHIVRNSLDHGIELPEVRRRAGKPAEGRLVIRASQEADRVVIDISDDGKGIDPAVIKRKAYEKGIIDEALLERITDQDAVNLVFAAGFSTVEVVSDLSGRGVGMDVVRSAVEQVNGTVTLESKPGQGTRLRLSLPLSMAVTNVMIIESDKQIFGVPMDAVVETVRVPRSAIHSIKNRQTTVLRGRIVPLRPLNDLLAADKAQVPNAEDEFATLVIRMKGEHIGIVVDDFREVVDIILKPMGGILGGLSGYSGSALLGDGSVLMVLNPKELV